MRMLMHIKTVLLACIDQDCFSCQVRYFLKAESEHFEDTFLNIYRASII